MKTDLDRQQLLAVSAIAGLLAGLLVLPFVVQRFYGVDAIKTAFGVILVYALVNWMMKRNLLQYS